jgi:hypothetical protein
MRRTHLRPLILSGLLVVAIIAAGSHLQSGNLFAMQQPSNSSQGSAAGSNSNYGVGTDTNPDAVSSQEAQPGGMQQPAAPNQARTEPVRAGMPWGWIIGSFIAGLIIGGILFSGGRGSSVRYNDRDLRDRDDFRRSA